MQAPRPGIPVYAPNRRGEIRGVYRSSDGRLVAFSSSGSVEEPAAAAEEESDAIAEEELASDEFEPWPPLPREQAGLPTRERFTQTLTVYPRNAANIPGAHGPIEDPNGFPEALHDVRVPWNIFRHRFKFEVRRYGHDNIRFIAWRRDLQQVIQEATIVHTISEEDYNSRRLAHTALALLRSDGGASPNGRTANTRHFGFWGRMLLKNGQALTTH